MRVPHLQLAGRASFNHDALADGRWSTYNCSAEMAGLCVVPEATPDHNVTVTLPAMRPGVSPRNAASVASQELEEEVSWSVPSSARCDGAVAFICDQCEHASAAACRQACEADDTCVGIEWHESAVKCSLVASCPVHAPTVGVSLQVVSRTMVPVAASVWFAPPIPTLGLAEGQPVFASDNRIQYDLTFSAPVSGLSGADFIVESLAPVLSVELQGSGQTYQLGVVLGDCPDATCIVLVELPAAAGLVEPPNVASLVSPDVYYDDEPPTAQFNPAPASVVASTTVQIQLGCTEPSCTYAFSLDGGNWRSVTASASSDNPDIGDVAYNTVVVVHRQPGLLTTHSDVSLQVSLGWHGHSGTPAPPVSTNTTFLVSVDNGAEVEVRGANFSLPPVGVGHHTLVIRRATDRGSSAFPTAIEWLVVEQAGLANVVANSDSVSAQHMPAWGYCTGSTVDVDAVFVASCATSGVAACELQTHIVADAGGCRWVGTTASSIALFPWVDQVPRAACSDDGTVQLRLVDATGSTSDALAVPAEELAPLPRVSVLRSPTTGTATARRARGGAWWDIAWAIAPSPGVDIDSLGLEYRDGSSTDWQPVDVSRGQSPTLSGDIAVPTIACSTPTSRLVQLRVVAVTSACVAGTPQYLRVGDITNVTWVEHPTPSDTPLPQLWWHPSRTVAAKAADVDEFKWTAGPDCTSCASRYRVLRVDSGTVTVVAPWLRLEAEMGAFSASVPRTIGGLRPSTLVSSVDLRVEVVTLAPTVVGNNASTNFALVAWTESDVVSYEYSLLGVPATSELAVQVVSTSLPQRPALDPVVLPHTSVAIVWKAPPDPAVFVEYTVCAHEADAPAGLPACDVASSGRAVGVVGEANWTAQAHLHLKPLPGTVTYSALARASTVGGWHGDVVATTWTVDAGQVVLLRAPPVLNPLPVATFRFALENAGMQQRIIAEPWSLWLEYRVVDTATSPAPESWIRALADEELTVGPVPAGATFRLDVRVRAPACSYCWQAGLGVLPAELHVEEPDFVGPHTSWTWTVEVSGQSLLVLPNLHQGPHNLLVRAADRAGIQQLTPISADFTVDTVPPNASAQLLEPSISGHGGAVMAWLPAVTDNGPPAFATNATAVRWQLAVSDNVLAEGYTRPCTACTAWYILQGPHAASTLIDTSPPVLRPDATATPWTAMAVGDTATADVLVPRNDSGWYAISVASSDAVLNTQPAESITTYAWFVDRTPPNVTTFTLSSRSRMVTQGPQSLVTNDTDIEFRVGSVDDDAASFQILVRDQDGVTVHSQKVDAVRRADLLTQGSQWVEDTTLLAGATGWMTLTHGSFTAIAVAVDALGNVDLSPPRIRIVVDTIAPTTAVPSVQRNPLNATFAELVLSLQPPTERLAGFHVDVTFAAAGSAAVPAVGHGVPPFVSVHDVDAGIGATSDGHIVAITPHQLLSGTYWFTAHAEDVAGNVDPVGAVLALVVDLDAPQTHMASFPAPLEASTSATLSVFSTGDTGCTFTAVVSGAGEKWWGHATAAVGSANATVTVVGPLPQGPVRAAVVATDRAGNVDPTGGVEFGWFVDTVPPVTVVELPPTVQSRHFTQRTELDVSVSCRDATACEFVPHLDATLVNTSGWNASVAPLRVSAPDEGSHTLRVFAVDRGGNTGNATIVTWTTDQTEPGVFVTAWAIDESDPALASVVFADAGYTVDALASGLSPPFAQVSQSHLAPPTSRTALAAAIGCAESSGSPCSVVAQLEHTEPVTVGGCDTDTGSGGAVGSGITVLPTSVLFTDNATAVAPLAATGSGAALASDLVPSETYDVSAGAQLSFGAVQIAALPDGRYDLYLRGMDRADNFRELTLSWHVDTAPPAKPVLTTSLPASRVTSAASLGVGIACSDTSPQLERARIFYLLDAQPGATPTEIAADQLVFGTHLVSAELVLGDSPGSVTGGLKLSDGGHKLTVWLVDGAGNAGVREDLRWTVLSQGPCTQLIRTPAATSGRAVAEFHFRAVQPKVSGGNCTLASDDSVLAPVPNVTFQVQLNPPEWITVCAVNAPGTYHPPSAQYPFGLCVYGQQLPKVDETYLMAVRAVNSLGVPSVEPATHTWRYEDCDKGEFAVVDEASGAIACTACPDGADCPGGLVEETAVQASPGWWSTPSSLQFYKCPIPGACLGKRSTDNGTVLGAGCAQGYTGLLCALCDDGYFQQFGKCAACPASREGVWLLTSTIVVVGCLVLAGLYWIRAALPIDVIGIIVTFCQVRCGGGALCMLCRRPRADMCVPPSTDCCVGQHVHVHPVANLVLSVLEPSQSGNAGRADTDTNWVCDTADSLR